MLLAAGGLTDFLKFLQIFCWITIPIFLSAIFITTLFHYRKKGKKKPNSPEIDAEQLLSGNLELSPVPADHALGASLAQIKQFRKKLISSNARYSALKKDIKSLEEKYNKLILSKINNETETFKQLNMENTNTGNQQDMQNQVDQFNDTITQGRDDLMGHVHILTNSNQKLEEENRILREHIQVYTSTDGNPEKMIRKFQDEKDELKKRLSSLEYLEDIVEEKMLQIKFLQQQLDARIKMHHEAENKFSDLSGAVCDMKSRSDEAAAMVNELRTEMEKKQGIENELRNTLEARSSEHEQLRNELTTKTEHLVYLESIVNELRSQNEELNALKADKEDIINNITAQLREFEDRNRRLTDRLSHNHQLIHRLQKEIALVVESESEYIDAPAPSSPVIVMSPVPGLTQHSIAGNQ